VAVGGNEQVRSPALARARRATTLAFAVEGLATGAVFTTVPAVQAKFGISTGAVTGLLVAVSLAAAGGSFSGLAALRRWGNAAALRAAVAAMGVVLLLLAVAPVLPVLVPAYVLFGLAIGAVDVTVNTRAADLEREYGHSIFVSFYAAWSAAGAAAALITAGAARLDWPGALVLAPLPWITVARIGRTGRTAAEIAAAESVKLGAAVWRRLLPLGAVLLVVYVIDSTTSAWTTVYLHQSLHATAVVAPLGYAAYQAGTVLGRAFADRGVRRAGPVPIMRGCALLTAVGLVGVAAAAGAGLAIAAAAVVGLGVSALVPLCLATAGRLAPAITEAVLARLNVFNYVGVVAGGALGGILGSSGHFRVAYAAPAVVVAALPLLGRAFARRPGPA
jgi:MFS family permease